MYHSLYIVVKFVLCSRRRHNSIWILDGKYQPLDRKLWRTKLVTATTESMYLFWGHDEDKIQEVDETAFVAPSNNQYILENFKASKLVFESILTLHLATDSLVVNQPELKTRYNLIT
jgi:hypothetical protein